MGQAPRADPNGRNRRAHNERGGFKFGACSATACGSPLLRVKDERDPLPDGSNLSAP